MKTKINKLLLGTLLLTASIHVNAEEQVIEIVDPLRVVFDKQDNTGYVLYRFCEGCKEEKLLLTENTGVYANKKRVPLSRVMDRLGRHVSLVYAEHDNGKDKEVIGIEW